MRATILIADDNQSMRHAVRLHILRVRPDWEICGEASDGEQAMQAVMSLKPDIVLVDIGMPVMGGLEVSARIAKLGLTSRVLLFTAHESQSMKNAMRIAGAQGYVDKARAVRDLVVGIESVLAGQCFWGS